MQTWLSKAEGGEAGVGLNAESTEKCPKTQASNLYATFPLNPTRLPVTSDTARQKFPFTAHGQHGGQKTKYNGPTHPIFFRFCTADIEL